MNRWYGKVGYSETVEAPGGVWESKDTVHEYYGDVKRSTSRWTTNPDSTNDDLTLSTQISIVADPFAIEKFYSMKWIEYLGVRWKITNVDPQPPRLILTLGEKYNG